MPLNAYQAVSLPPQLTSPYLFSLLGVDPGFLQFYRQEPCDASTQFESNDAVLIVPPYIAFFDELSQELALAYQLDAIQAKSQYASAMLVQVTYLAENSDNILAAVAARILLIKQKLMQYYTRFRPVQQNEALQIQNIIKQEYPFIKQRLDEHKKAIYTMLGEGSGKEKPNEDTK